MRRYRCGEPRNNDSAPWNAKKGKGPEGLLGRAPPKMPSSVPPTVSERPHVVPPRGAPSGAGVVSAPSSHSSRCQQAHWRHGQGTQAPPECHDKRGLLKIREGGHAFFTQTGEEGEAS